MAEAVESPDVFSSGAPLAQAIRAGEFLFISGQIARTTEGAPVTDDLAAEVRAVLDNVQAILNAAGGSLADICKMTVYLTDPALFEAFNETYREIIGPDQFPARTTVFCQLARPNLRVEIDAVAWLPPTR